MADREFTAVAFTLEKNVVQLYAKILFGAGGVPSLSVPWSKGFCNVSTNTVAFTATSANASPTLTGVSSFAGIYIGMLVQDVGPTHVNATITAMNPGAGTITLSANATGTNIGLTASGGLLLQLGTQAGVRLDTYNKLLSVATVWDETGLNGGMATAATSPTCPVVFLSGDQTAIRTIPQVGNSQNTDATMTLMIGSYVAGVFTVATPTSGEALRVSVDMGNSTAL